MSVSSGERDRERDGELTPHSDSVTPSLGTGSVPSHSPVPRLGVKQASRGSGLGTEARRKTNTVQAQRIVSGQSDDSRVKPYILYIYISAKQRTGSTTHRLSQYF